MTEPIRYQPSKEPEEALEDAVAFFNSLGQPDWDNAIVRHASEQGFSDLRQCAVELDPLEVVLVAFFQMIQDTASLSGMLVRQVGASPQAIAAVLNCMATLPQVIIHFMGETVTIEDLEALGLTFEEETE